MTSTASSEEAAKEVLYLHFVLLHHGYHGCARDFYYLSEIAEEALKHQGGADHTASPHLVFIHPSGSDRLRTEEGVMACAERYIAYACEVISHTLSLPPTAAGGTANGNDGVYSVAESPNSCVSPVELHFSAVGHSMGGLILRAAFPRIMAKVEQLVAQTPRVRGVHWDTFCTMATPHLGVHYMRSPIVTFLGKSVGHHISHAIADLFSKNSLLTRDLVTDESLAAWARFQRRVVLSVVNDGTVLVYSSSFVMPISVRKRIGAPLPPRTQPELSTPPASQTVFQAEAVPIRNINVEPSEIDATDAARRTSHIKDPLHPPKMTSLDAPNTDISVVDLAEHGVYCASTVEGLRRNEYQVKELSEDLWPAALLPEPRALAERILQHVGPLELHLIDFRPLCDAPPERLPKRVAAARAKLSLCGRSMTHLGAHRFSHAAMACKSPFYYPEFFGFVSEYVVSDLLGIALNT
jgi:hypothetical protein